MTDLTEAKRLVEAATPGPWHVELEPEDAQSWYICHPATVCPITTAAEVATEADAALIAWAGTHLKALIAAHEAALRENEALREGLRFYARAAAYKTYEIEDEGGQMARALLGDRS